MTTRDREQTLAFSEELSALNCPGSFLFSEPGVVDHWCQSLPGGTILPLTPPDTDSEPDMTAKWTQTSLPEDSWYTGPAQEHSTYVQSSSSEWDAQTLFSSAQDYQPLDAFHWSNTSHGSVDMGLSPVLSHESQSSHTLNSFSESELPSGLDLPLTYEHTWNTAGSLLCHENQPSQRQLPGHAFVPSLDEMPLGPRMDDALTQWPMDFNGCSVQPMLYSQGAQTARQTMRSPATAPQRILLPRTESSLVSTPAFGQTSMQRPNRPSLQGCASSRRSSQSVSTNGYVVQESPRIAAGQYIAPRPVTTGVSEMPSTSAMERVQTVPQSHTLPRTYAQDSFSAIMDPAADDFTAFIQYDQDEPSTVTGSSYSTSLRTIHANSPNETAQADRPKIALDAKPIKVSPKPATALPSEVDEGRHRNHPLYSQGPDSDGMFRCPFKAKENCPHTATKLKCNYDKFVDSHLKPFRCRQEACAKQEFSSTACLLRHEREAHGMHGHGDRPHLCFYTGCERGLPGNGFPRRYNLFDHMKRVHDHREDNSSGLASPDLTAAEASIQRKSAGRKRKAPSSTTSESATQKRKTSPQIAAQDQTQTVLLPRQEATQAPAKVEHDFYATQDYAWPTPSRAVQYSAQVAMDQELSRNVQYPQQWASARDSAFVQSSPVEIGMPLFDQNFQGSRRLSNESRHG